jgi:hypothetical protein
MTMVTGAPDGVSVDGRTAISGNFRTRSTELWINAHTFDPGAGYRSSRAVYHRDLDEGRPAMAKHADNGVSF